MVATRTRLTGVALLAVLVTGCGATPDTGADPGAGSSPSVSAVPSGAGGGETDDGGAVPATTRSVPGPRGAAAEPAVVPRRLRPSRISIPSIGVDASTIQLGIRGDGAIEVPSDARETGWLTSTPAPGQQGPAVVAGHVDSTSGPAVFYDLRTLQVGDAITITRHDGSTVDFTVDGVEQYSQDVADFPTDTVYGPVPGPALRLITCGGDYIKSEGGYQDNVVVYAS